MAEHNGESCIGTQTIQHFSQVATHLPLLVAPTFTPTAPPTSHNILPCEQ